jgi:hypothetical protein
MKEFRKKHGGILLGADYIKIMRSECRSMKNTFKKIGSKKYLKDFSKRDLWNIREATGNGAMDFYDWYAENELSEDVRNWIEGNNKTRRVK